MFTEKRRDFLIKGARSFFLFFLLIYNVHMIYVDEKSKREDKSKQITEKKDEEGKYGIEFLQLP